MAEDKGGIYALLVVIIILILGAFAYFGGFFGGRGDGDSKKIEVDIGKDSK